MGINNCAVALTENQSKKTKTTSYREIKVGKTLYKITSTYKGEFELGKALEDLTVKRVLRSASPLLNTDYTN